MPLSELWKFATGMLESGQQRSFPADMLRNDLVELVWENGPIMMQSQSNMNSIPSNMNRIHAAIDGQPSASRIRKSGGVGSILEDMSSVVPSGELDVSQDDEMEPWLNYPIGDGSPQDYVSDLLPEISGVTATGMSQNSFVSMEKTSNCDSGGNAVNGHINAAFGNAPGGKAVANESASMEIERPDTRLPTCSSNFLNFPYFSRPVTITKSNLTSISSGVVRIDVKDRGSTSGGNCHPKSSFVGPRKDFNFGAASRKRAVEESEEIQLPERTENVSKEPSIKNEKLVISGDRNVEATFVSSSVGSGYSADRASNGCTHNSKRTFHDIEESDCHSDDFETASVGVKKATPARLGCSSKRSRAAEVHNLSERRRRDRINEKMRALQELLPNCNKVDKASMLDEAIEYLKTLQLQVQIMSMGAGLCMPPPMMLPRGMQQIHPSYLPHFSSMGFGMGIRDMGGRSPGYPIFPVPHAQVAHFPPPPSHFQRIPVPNLAMHGYPSSVPRASTVQVVRQPSGTVLCGSRSGNPNEVPDSSPALSSVDPLTNKDTQPKFSAEASNPNHKLLHIDSAI